MGPGAQSLCSSRIWASSIGILGLYLDLLGLDLRILGDPGLDLGLLGLLLLGLWIWASSALGALGVLEVCHTVCHLLNMFEL